MSRFLTTMAERSRFRADQLASRRSLQEVRDDARAALPRRPLGAFGTVFDVIAEIKPRSPAEGAFAVRSSVALDRANDQRRAGLRVGLDARPGVATEQR